MPSIDNAPIIKAWAEDTSNKDAPSQTAIGTGIEYASPLVSSEPNGALYLIFKAAKYLQRTGGMYSPTIPYIRGQSCSLLCVAGTRFEIRQFICDSATDITNTPPLTGATVTDVNGVPCYSGGVLSASWQDADHVDGYAPTTYDIPYNGTVTNLPAHAAINVGKRQYVNSSSPFTGNPEINRVTSIQEIIRAPTIEEVLSLIEYPYKGPFCTANTLQRLGVYYFRGQKVEAFAFALAGDVFSDNGTSNRSKFWRSFSSVYPSQCVINNTVIRDCFFSGTAGGTITTKDYRGRVPVCEGTATLTSGTSEARAALGGVQDDQMQGHYHSNPLGTQLGAILRYGSLSGSNASQYSLSGTTTGDSLIGPAVSDPNNGTPRIGHNTREATYSVPVPMVVSLLPYGEITL